MSSHIALVHAATRCYIPTALLLLPSLPSAAGKAAMIPLFFKIISPPIPSPLYPTYLVDLNLSAAFACRLRDAMHDAMHDAIC